MERAEAKGLGVAVAGHIALLAALTYSLRPSEDPPAPPPSVEVSFVEEVALEAATPTPVAEPPPASTAPDLGPPEEAAPQPEPAPPEPTPAPPAPAPQPIAQPRPQPQPRQAMPAPTRPQLRPQPRPQPPAAAQPQRPAVRPAPQRPAPSAQRTPQRSGTQTAERPRGSRLSPDLLKGIGNDPAPPRAPNPPAAVTGQARAQINAAIQRALIPCERQPLPAPEAASIQVVVQVTLNRDGSLADADVSRVINDNPALARHEQRMGDLALRVIRQCTPIGGLPPELYDVPRGWRRFPYVFDPR